MNAIIRTLFVTFFVVFALPAFADSTNSHPAVIWNPVYEHEINDGEPLPQLKLNVDRSPGRGIGLFSYTRVFEGYAQEYGGPTFNLKPWFQGGLGAGAEFHDSDAFLRLNIWGSTTYGPATLLIWTEHGQAFWGRLEAKYQVKDFFNVGLMSQTSLGTGPRLELKKRFGSVEAAVWGTEFFTDEWLELNHLVGVQVTF